MVANYYYRHIDSPYVTLPGREEWLKPTDQNPFHSDNVFHIFPILTPYRADLQQYLKDQGVGTMIHYPIPPHHQQCYAEWNSLSLPVTEKIHSQELSLPCNQVMPRKEVAYVAQCVNRFVPHNP